MGASQSTPKLAEVLAATPRSGKNIHVERIIDGNCDYMQSVHPMRQQIIVGLCTGSDEKNPMNNQCMRVGDEDPVSLLAFNQTTNTLSYTFEKDVTLQVSKRDNNEIYYHLKTPTYDVTRSIHPSLYKLYKPIGGSLTLELDKLKELF